MKGESNMLKRNIGLCFLFLFLFLFLRLVFSGYAHVADDIWFSNVSLTEPDHIKWLVGRYHNWTSRIPIEFVLIETINHFYAWAFLNSTIFSFLICSLGYLAYKFTSKVSGFYMGCFLFFLFFWIIPKDIVFESAIWMTGSFNYLWPVGLSSVGIAFYCSLIFSEKKSLLISFLSAVFLFFSSFGEQVAIVNVFFVFLCFVAINKKINFLFLLPMAAVLFAFSIVLTCPGNAVRYVISFESFKGYESFGVFEKIILGLNLLGDQFLSKASLIPCLFFLTLSFMFRSFFRKIALVFSFMVILCNLFLHKYFSDVYLSQNSVHDALYLFRAVGVSVLFLVYLLGVLFSEMKSITKIFMVGVLFSVAATTSMLGFSPTIYVSGNRVFFVSFIIMSAAISFIWGVRFSKCRFCEFCN